MLMWVSVAIHCILFVTAVSLLYMHQSAFEIVFMCMVIVSIFGTCVAANDATDVYLDVLENRSIAGQREGR
jgi:TRAP-type C4-dicarboxylate transport system permease small subunit